MPNSASISITPSKVLYTMIRVSNLEKSIKFYTETLGMMLIRKEEYPEGRFTLAFVGYSNCDSESLIELTFNWDQTEYTHGTAYGHIALSVHDLYASCSYLENCGVTFTRRPGPMKFSSPSRTCDELIAFIEDPDGFKIELIQSEE